MVRMSRDNVGEHRVDDAVHGRKPFTAPYMAVQWLPFPFLVAFDSLAEISLPPVRDKACGFACASV